MSSADKLKVAILFGGWSREREVSFAGGRSVYDNLDRSVYEPVPVFIDSVGNLVELNWKYLYRGTIRDFYPVAELMGEYARWHIYAESLLPQELEPHLRQVGRPTTWEELADKYELAVLVLHGPGGEDGSVQGLCEMLGLPYTGCGIFPSALCIDKWRVRQWLGRCGFPQPQAVLIRRKEWLTRGEIALQQVETKVKEWGRAVVKPVREGSSIGVSVVEAGNPLALREAIDRALFVKRVEYFWWRVLSDTERSRFAQELVDVRYSIGYPVSVLADGEVVAHARAPWQLIQVLNSVFTEHEQVLLEGSPTGEGAIVEEWLEGEEFSCIVLEDEKGAPVALPPTKIIKRTPVYTYRAKYLAGVASKQTPPTLPYRHIRAIQEECEKAYTTLGCEVYARIDGIVSAAGTVYINDPNTTSGMLPSSLLFQQTATVGMGPTQFLNYLIERSCSVRSTGKRVLERLSAVSGAPVQRHLSKPELRVAVVLGGWSSERHISVESGRNVWEKLSASGMIEPIPFFLVRDKNRAEGRLYRLPLYLLFKDNADDVRHELELAEKSPIIEEVRSRLKWVVDNFAPKEATAPPEPVPWEELKQRADFVFLALHGRPGEDGTLQRLLDHLGIPYNGSDPHCSAITMDKYLTGKVLAEAGISTPLKLLVSKDEWKTNRHSLVEQIERKLGFPLIAKPVDDGCSTAVLKLHTRHQLELYAHLTFREDDEEEKATQLLEVLGLPPDAEFPAREQFLVEELVRRRPGDDFLEEITVGLISQAQGYRVFVPSQVVRHGAVLTLEEKFLAGEGENITPPVFVADPSINQKIVEQVKTQIEQVARTLNIRGYARVDAFVRGRADASNVDVVVLEVNSLPGLTPATCLFHQAAEEGFTPMEFLLYVIEEGYRTFYRRTDQKHPA